MQRFLLLFFFQVPSLLFTFFLSVLNTFLDAELNSRLANDFSNGTGQSATTPSETPESNNNSEQEEGTGNSLTDEVQ